MQNKTHFIFDLDGTVTASETLPLIGTHFQLGTEISAMTSSAIIGNVPYVENFIKRVNLLAKLPVDEVAEIIASVPMHRRVSDFICKHASQCSIATTNLDVWLSRMSELLPCSIFCSQAEIEDNSIKRLRKILKKEAVVERFQKDGFRVVFIGEGHNDMEAMRVADISIASGLTHKPAQGVLSIADYLCCEENSLCGLLERLC